MKGKYIISIATVIFCIAGLGAGDALAGAHYGELKMIEADITFSGQDGSCIADSSGVTYIIGGAPYPNPNLVYPSIYWGTYKLYFPGTTVPAQITITNLGPRAIAKHTIVSEAYVINLDGSNGTALITPQTQVIEVALGETKTINLDIALPIAVKGLNRVVVKILHHKNDTNDASMVLQKEAIFCPPEDIGDANQTEAVTSQLQPAVEAYLEVEPNSLQLGSKGKWVKSYLWLPEDCNIVDVNTATISLQGVLKPKQIWLDEDEQMAMAKFSRQELINILEPNEATLLFLTGLLNDSTPFVAIDTIKVLPQAGQWKMLDADIVFFDPAGEAITSGIGIIYIINNIPYPDPSLIYSSAYWGTYPLYLPNTTAQITLTITNTGPHAVAKYTLKTECYAINLDGSNGASLITPQIMDIEVALGETKVIDASFTLPLVPKGLYRFILSLYHHLNENNEDASLILQKEGVFCPPEIFE